jgi:hypothetical protein
MSLPSRKSRCSFPLSPSPSRTSSWITRLLPPSLPSSSLKTSLFNTFLPSNTAPTRRNGLSEPPRTTSLLLCRQHMCLFLLIAGLLSCLHYAHPELHATFLPRPFPFGLAWPPRPEARLRRPPHPPSRATRRGARPSKPPPLLGSSWYAWFLFSPRPHPLSVTHYLHSLHSRYPHLQPDRSLPRSPVCV